MQSKLKYNFLYRCVTIVWMVLKFIFQIYFFHVRHRMLDERARKKWDALLIRQAREYKEKAIKLGGVLVKVGQFLSMRTDFMPTQFTQELTGLVDRVPAGSLAYAQSLLTTEWGEDQSTHLQKIESRPVASASIGEVYRGTMTDGTEVAIKIQRYRIQAIFHMDFKALKIVFWIISVFTSFGKKADLQALYRELIYVMERELDFKQELAFGQYFKERYLNNKSIQIPTYYEALCTSKVLVMDWMEGAKITDLQFLKQHQLDRKETAKLLFDFYLDQYLHEGYFHADPHAGNIIINKEGKLAIIDFGMVGTIRKLDTTYFKRIIQGLITDDYDAIIETLEEMNFLLPNANKHQLKKMIKQTFDLYDSGAFKKMDAKALDLLLNEIRIFIKEQPIQLSAEYIYLGRAISLIIGILITLYPTIDIGSWAKPKIKQWLGGRFLFEAIYQQKVRQIIQPFVSLPQAMVNWLESGEKQRHWEMQKQNKQQMHHVYLLLEFFLFILLVWSILLVQNEWTSYIRFSFALIGTFFVLLIIVLRKHKKMIKRDK